MTFGSVILCISSDLKLSEDVQLSSVYSKNKEIDLAFLILLEGTVYCITLTRAM